MLSGKDIHKEDQVVGESERGGLCCHRNFLRYLKFRGTKSEKRRSNLT